MAADGKSQQLFAFKADITPYLAKGYKTLGKINNKNLIQLNTRR